jgi:selenium metabolism protein YedF
MESLDCKGLKCPEPVLRVKKYLEKHGGNVFSVCVDNEASRENVLRFARSQGCEVSVSADSANCSLITVSPNGGVPEKKPFNEEEYPCEIPGGGNLIYVISSDIMGYGSDELGWALLQTYVTTIEQINPLPSHVLLYNGGVKLAATTGKSLEALQNLEKRGVQIWCCGTCLEFFHLEEGRKVGTITNMYDIMNTMATAQKVMSPF